MDTTVQRALHDKVYDKRKAGALELEKLIRDALAANDHTKIAKVVDQLCHDYAYAIHQPYARNGGLIGLAATAIALGPEVARYLEEIVPPVLSCFTDQDARVRYYACESMYNIAKTSKGEILPYFNEIFDALAKLTADSELSVKNGAELLDRLIKDIISESATTYVSAVHGLVSEEAIEDGETTETAIDARYPNAFSLPRFIPLLRERILVINPFTRMFLASWITLLDSIPDLELVSYIPAFLKGLFKFLTDSNQDVVTATQHILERFLDEIRHIAQVKRKVGNEKTKSSEAPQDLSSSIEKHNDTQFENFSDRKNSVDSNVDGEKNEDDGEQSISSHEADETRVQPDWMPGQDVHVDHPKILDILLSILDETKEEHIQLTALRWIDGFFEICPKDMVTFVPRLLDQVLPTLSSTNDHVRQAGIRVNTSLIEYIISITGDDGMSVLQTAQNASQVSTGTTQTQNQGQTWDEAVLVRRRTTSEQKSEALKLFDYSASVEALTRQFFNNSEATRVAALSGLIMLQRKAPKKVLAAHDGTFQALLKTLADTSDTVVTRDLQLLCQISRNSDDSYFTFFMVNLLKLFSNERRLLETRGNLIIRQLCIEISPERIYRTMADCLEKEEDPEFASIMVQNLNNNLITAPELADLRRKLRNWDSREGSTLFTALFRAWCHNAVATIALCLLAQAYEQAYNLVQFFAEIEMTVNMLIQIDKLVQLLESPVFTFLRLQLLEPGMHPHLYRCLYGILMLLPQSAAFAALKNRLNSVSAIGFLHTPGVTMQQPGRNTGTTPAQPAAVNRLKGREDNAVKWTELLDKFKSTQERARRARNVTNSSGVDGINSAAQSSASGPPHGLSALTIDRNPIPPGALSAPPEGALRNMGFGGATSELSADSRTSSNVNGQKGPQPVKEHKSRFSGSHFGKIASGVRGKQKSSKLESVSNAGSTISINTTGASEGDKGGGK